MINRTLSFNLMVKWFIISIIILFPIFQSCKKTIVSDVSFPLENKIISDSFLVPPIIYASHPGLVITGDKLILIEPNAENIFSIFKLPDCQFIGNFGVLGRGPEEFKNINPYSVFASAKGIRIFDHEKGILEVDITSFPEKTTSINIVKFPPIVQYLNSPFQINDSIVCGIPYPQVEIINGQPKAIISNQPFIRFNTISKEIDYFGDYPKLYSKKYLDQFWIIFMNMSIVKPDKQKFASFGTYIKTLNIYDNVGTLCKELIMKAPDDLLGDKSLTVNKVYYDAIKATDKFIYAICEDAPLNNLLKNRPTLEVWDWSGNPVISLKLDRPVAAFDVTKDDKFIYFIDRQTRNRIFTYNLTGLIR